MTCARTTPSTCGCRRRRVGDGPVCGPCRANTAATCGLMSTTLTSSRRSKVEPAADALVPSRLTRHREQLQYLGIGAWNTVFGYAVWALLEYLLHDRLSYLLIVTISYPIAIGNAYVCYRYIVFRSHRPILREIPRFLGRVSADDVESHRAATAAAGPAVQHLRGPGPLHLRGGRHLLPRPSGRSASTSSPPRAAPATLTRHAGELDRCPS